MDEYVRVADKETGHHLSIPKARYDADPNVWRLLKSDVTYADGTPRPAKYHTDASTEAAKTAAKSAGEQE